MIEGMTMIEEAEVEVLVETENADVCELEAGAVRREADRKDRDLTQKIELPVLRQDQSLEIDPFHVTDLFHQKGTKYEYFDKIDFYFSINLETTDLQKAMAISAEVQVHLHRQFIFK